MHVCDGRNEVPSRPGEFDLGSTVNRCPIFDWLTTNRTVSFPPMLAEVRA
jgi:hypothetical protein